ncbi:MerC domain-containing protein [Stenotrophomonas sp. S39]|uniref:MerC domain-containing protein n=1 Tax=Stenotrophomonas sp. S39 TaxID=2767451 RepID=UPI00190D82D1|nr:MerC domain-containing protein [Stenotrophomonas sp. S39]MBK0052687.1 MerC domain-containing protein [Stenotrophomonas sp. S39]
MQLTSRTSRSHTAPSKGRTLHRRFDLAAAWLSLTCALHCMLLPLILALLPGAMLALRSFQHPWHGPLTWLLRLSRWEWAIAAVAAALCVTSVGIAWQRHRRSLPMALAVAGSGCLLLASLHPQIRDIVVLHGLLSAIGGTLMASAHLVNRGITSHAA